MGIGRAFDATMDWMMSGPMPWALTKTFGCIALATAIIASPFVYISNQNANALQNRMDSLDSQYTHVFNSVSGCMDEGYPRDACEASQKEALDIAGELGTTLKYSGRSECIMNHQSCERVVTPITTYTRVGDVSIPNTVYVTNYHPAVVAWQAAQDDISESVPLYQTPQQDVAVRFDGATFDLR